jgi:hypothetical protein
MSTPITNVPTISYTSTGIVLPLDSAILNGVLADMTTAFGGNMSQSLSAPQGQLAQSFTAIISDKNADIAEILNQVDPANASGFMQDAIGNIYFMTRIAASGTLVTGLCNGLVGVLIPAGSLVQDTAGNTYASTQSGTIASNGFVSIPFQCTTPGPIGCAIGALSVIVSAVNGWDSVTNPAAGTPGTNVESRAAFELRRQNSVAINALSSTDAIRAAVLSVPNVLQAYVVDNPTNATVNTGSTNYPVAANSVYVAVAGGSAAAVAQAIWSKKSLGCSYNGNTSYTITDTSQGIPPYPTYTVQWETPNDLAIYFQVNLVNNANLPSNITQLVQNAVLAAFNGTDGGLPAYIGGELFAGRYYPGIGEISSNVQLLSVFIGTAANPSTTSQSIGIDELPTCQASNIAVVLH